MKHPLPFAFLFAPFAVAQSVLPPFDTQWHVDTVGPISGVSSYGGTAFSPTDSNVLMVSPWPSTSILAVPLVRNPQGQIVGAGTALPAITVGGTDGGLAYGPNNVLFATWFGANNMSQIEPGSTVADRVDNLTPLGITTTVGTCTFVPAGLPGAGRCKVCSWISSEFFDVTLTPDGNGTYDLGPATGPITLQGGIEGLVYVAAGAPLLAGQLLACEWSAGQIAAYQVDGIGNPLPATRQLVVVGAPAIGGGSRDPVTGDFVFLATGGQLIILRAGAVCGTVTNYGVPSPGASGTPTISGSGCSRIGQTVTFGFTGGANAIGLLALGSYPLNVVWQGLTILQPLQVIVPVVLGGTGTGSFVLTIPLNPALSNAHSYLQAAYLDAGTLSGFASSDGLDLQIR